MLQGICFTICLSWSYTIFNSNIIHFSKLLCKKLTLIDIFYIWFDYYTYIYFQLSLVPCIEAETLRVSYFATIINIIQYIICEKYCIICDITSARAKLELTSNYRIIENISILLVDLCSTRDVTGRFQFHRSQYTANERSREIFSTEWKSNIRHLPVNGT